MAKSSRASGNTENIKAAPACVTAVTESGTDHASNPAHAAEVQIPARRSAAKRHSADAIVVAVLCGLVFLAARNGATLWQVPRSNPPSKDAPEITTPALDPAAAREADLRRRQAERQRLLIAQLRTDVGNVLGGIEESRWSLATLKKARPAMDRLIVRAKAAGRDDLALYWRALAEHLESARAAREGNVAGARLQFANAVDHLGDLAGGEALADSTLRGDVISTIGGLLGTAKVLGIPASGPLVAELNRLRHRLKLEESAVH